MSRNGAAACARVWGAAGIGATVLDYGAAAWLWTGGGSVGQMESGAAATDDEAAAR